MQELSTREKDVIRVLQWERTHLRRVLTETHLLLIFIRTFRYDSIIKAITDILKRLDQIEECLNQLINRK